MEKLDQKKKPDQLIKEFDSKSKKTPTAKIVVLLVIMIFLGFGSGLFIVKSTSMGTKSSTEIASGKDVKSGDTFGVDDSNTFKDVAEGKLKEGGIEGEGQYHLERPGGETQYVYLTSSVVDLGVVKGRKIKVWGQTQKAQHAPWLMDVGRVEVLE